MPQLVKKRRSGWAVLAAGALVASLLAVGTGPAAAVEIDDSNLPRPSESTSWSACVGDAIEDAGFTDVSEDSVHADAINCIAYYGVTLGKTADTYAPGDNVARHQMVLFIERAAALTGADADDVLGDFAEDGSDPVTRADMAVLLVMLLADAVPSKVQLDSDDDYAVTYGRNGERDLDDGDNDPRTGPLDWFADARGETPRRVDNLITATYELGITNGTGDGTTFEPEGLVTRAQMASFITRTLAHTTVRPAGLSGQSVSSSVQISLRDNNFEPTANEWIDAFYVEPDRVDDAFRANGSCSRLPDTAPDGATRCKVDKGDMLTEADGNVEFSLPLTFVSDERTLWAWTGDTGDTFDDETEPVVELDVVQGLMPANRAIVTSNMRPGATEARYGAKITHTIQLQHYNATTGVVLEAVPLGQDFAYRLITTLRNAPAPGGDPGSGGLLSQNSKVITIGTDGTADFVITAADPQPHRRDENAPREVEFYLVPLTAGTTIPIKIGQGGTGTDPTDGGHPNDYTTTTDGPDDGSPATLESTGTTNGYVQFDDDAGSVQAVVLIDGAAAQGPFYEYQDSGGETAYVTVAALNEYGETVSGVRVKVSAAGTDACLPLLVEPTVDVDGEEVGVNSDGDPSNDVVVAKEYQTGRFGTARIAHPGLPTETRNSNAQTLVVVYPGSADGAGYESTCRPSATGGHVERGVAVQAAQEVTADLTADPPVLPVTLAQAQASAFANADLITPDSARPTLHWIAPDSAAGATGSEPVVVVDTTANEVVVGEADNVDPNDFVLVLYDSTDQFKVNGISKSMEKFEGALDDAVSDDRVTAVTLVWSGYDYRDPDEITEWNLTFTDGRTSVVGREPLG